MKFNTAAVLGLMGACFVTAILGLVILPKNLYWLTYVAGGLIGMFWPYPMFIPKEGEEKKD